MKVIQLRDLLNTILEKNLGMYDKTVAVYTEDPSIGGCSKAKVCRIQEGFDFDSKYLLIFTEEELIKL